MIQKLIVMLATAAIAALWLWSGARGRVADHAPTTRATTSQAWRRTLTLILSPLRVARWAVAGWAWRSAARADQRELATAAALLNYDTPPAVELPAWRSTRPVWPVDDRCPNPSCGSRRCRPWWEGRDCEADQHQRPAAYAAGHPLPANGRHSMAVRIPAYWRRVRLDNRRLAVQLDPTWWAHRLGRPVQLAGHARTWRLP
jgi:hypothetical protein